MPTPAEWTVGEVSTFLSRIGLPKLGPTWAEAHKINGAMLKDLIDKGHLEATLGDPPQSLLNASKIRTQLAQLDDSGSASGSDQATKYPPRSPTPAASTPAASWMASQAQAALGLLTRTVEGSRLSAGAGDAGAESPREGARKGGRGRGELTRTGAEVRPCYLATPPSEIKHDVKSAGVLVVRRSSNKPEGIEALLPVEYKAEGRVLNLLGGQDDPRDGGDPLHTAAREFYEETGSILNEMKVRQILRRAQRVYLGFGKYVLYVVRPTEQSLFHKLNVRYNTTYSWLRGHHAEAEFLTWVPWHELEAARCGREGSAFVEVTHETHPVYLRSSLGPYGKRVERVRVSEFLSKTVASSTLLEAIKLALNECPGGSGEADLGARISAELATCQQLSTMGDDGWLTTKLGSSWQLKLTAPPNPPPFPITSHPPNGPDWKRILAMARLPANLASRVVSVRECHISSRQAEYASEKRALERKMGAGAVQELKYPMHGTPERWRATAIAINGFDMGIQLHGRAQGNGVYSVLNEPSTPLSFTANAGSLLVMKALFTPDGLANKGATPTDGGVLVFANPKHVLPEAIVDFADADQEKDSLAKLHAEQAELIKKRAEEHKTVRGAPSCARTPNVPALTHNVVKPSAALVHLQLVRDMEEKEKVFIKDHLAMGRIALTHYHNTLKLLLREREDLGRDAPDAALISLDVRFKRERKQFADGLPIYAHKPKLVEALKGNQVLLVTAPTGSGKSTQLPQYMLDEVIDARDTRQVAVLQPRRVNASTLCERVAEERGGIPGQEIGYTVGRGESNESDETRIHFMTHGLFVQRAQNMETFAKSYAAVLLDEAHERSVEIDVSFALLRELAAKHRVRVVIMSATIGSDSGTPSVASRFQEFMAAPFGTQPPLMALQGSAFPVFVRRCAMPDTPDPEGMSKTLGSAGNAAVLASLAIQHAVDILRTTKDGNVLVFFPGEADINRAMHTVRNIVATGGGDGSSDGSGGGWSTTSAEYGSFYGNSSPFLGANSQAGFSFLLPETQEGATLISTTGSAFGFGAQPKVQHQKVGVYPFHGKLSPAERDQAVDYHEDRVVIFTTNYAETGLTIPNVRYVIDTGLERRARWNPQLCMRELTTQSITRSSMHQRTGRAGRVASGICVRLYSEEQEAQFDELPPPSILEEDSQKVVLQLLELKRRCGRELKMIDSIPALKWKASTRQLLEFGALDKTTGEPSEGGKRLLRLGLDYRTGRFLLRCSTLDCLDEGTMLAAMLACPGSEKLLPARPADGKADGGAAKLKDFEVSTSLYRWKKVDVKQVREVLTKVLAGNGPSSYEVDGQQYEVSLRSPGAIVQTKTTTGSERNIREVSTDADVGAPSERFHDETGDHWTLLRMMQAYHSEAHTEGVLNWCQRNGLQYHIMSEADTTYQHLQDQCVNLRMPTPHSVWAKRGGAPPAELKAKVLEALCAAYYDQLCAAKDPNHPVAGFVRLIPAPREAAEMASAQSAFRKRYGPQTLHGDGDGGAGSGGSHPVYIGDDVDGAATSAQTSQQPIDSPQLPLRGDDVDPDPANPPEIVLRLEYHSTVWKQIKGANAAPHATAVPPGSGQPTEIPTCANCTMGPLLLFNSVMLTNGAHVSPSMHIASFVEPDMVKAGAPQDWCSNAQFDQMMRTTAERACFTYSIGNHNRDIFLRDHGDFFAKMHRRFRSVHIELSPAGKGSVLKVTCHKALVDLIKQRVERRIQMLQQEEVYLPVPHSAKIGNFIGVGGAELKKLQQDLGDLVRNALGEEDYENKKLPSWIFVEGRAADGSWSSKANPKERVRIVLKGRVKALIQVIVGRVRSALIEKCVLHSGIQGSVWPQGNLPTSAPGASSVQMLRNPRLMFLSQRQPPPPPSDEDGAKLHVAHAAIFSAGATVYGGFVRDWVIRGESANDVDVNTSDYDGTERSMRQALQSVGIVFQSSQPGGENKAYRRLTFSWQGSQIDVDLVDPRVVPHTPPGVDCDVGNLKIDSGGGLQLKAPKLGAYVSLAKSIKHVLSKKFVLFYEPSGKVAQKRLHKYLQRGWTCKSPVPGKMGLPAQLIKTKSKYSHAFWRQR